MLLKMFLIFLQFLITQSVLPCSEILRVNITDGTKMDTDGSIMKDGIIFHKKNYYESEETLWGCPCNIKLCIRKCCDRDSVFNWDIQECEPSNETDLVPEFYNGIEKIVENRKISEFSLVYGLNCGQDKTQIIAEIFHVQHNGSVITEKKITKNPEDYCLDNGVSGNDSELFVMACEVPDPENKTMKLLHTIGMIISMPFLLATFIIYCALPDKNLHQKALMFYVINLLLAYTFMVIIQLNAFEKESPCKFLGFGTVFFFMGSFFWMNVICIDIWYVFCGSKGFIGSKVAAERRRFVYYFMYACGTPFLHTLIVITINENIDTESSFFPGVKRPSCFLRSNLSQLIYFYWLIALLITTNIILFSITAFKIKKIKRETSILKRQDSKRHVYESDKQRFNLYLKLLFAMGVNWSMEFISFFVKWATSDDIPEELWYLTDFCNASYGVFIFFLFVFKKKTWKMVKLRYYTCIGRSHKAFITTNSTQTSYTSARKVSVAESATMSEAFENQKLNEI